VLATANDAALRLKPTDINGESLELLKRGDIAAFRKGGNGKWMPSPERPGCPAPRWASASTR
jgi:hypothetical protein